MKLDSFDKTIFCVIAFLIFTFAACIAVGAYYGNKFDQECASAGGHSNAMYRSTLCVTPDGRIIDL